MDLIMLTYRTKDPVTMATNLCSVVVEGNEIGMSVSVRGNDPMMASRDEMMRYLDALDLTDVKACKARNNITSNIFKFAVIVFPFRVINI